MPGVIVFLSLCVQHGFATEAMELLAEGGKAEEWRPLYEAMRAISEKNPKTLARLAPEVQKPAEELYRELTKARELAK